MTENTEEQKKNRTPWLDDYKFKPGQSGNPNGRPKGESITAKLRKILESEYTDGKTVADHIVNTIVKEILSPSGKYGFNTPLLREILERVEGKVPDKHEIETGDISIVYKQVKKDE